MKSYLDLHDEIAYYLCSDEYGTRRYDDPSSAEASRYWEGQLWVAVRNGGLCFLFENTGSRFPALLKDLNLKLVVDPPPHPAPAPANSPTPASAHASTSPGGRIASTDDSASGSAPSGLMASVVEEDYDSDWEFCWTGDEDGVLYSVDSNSRKSNNPVAPYPSCSHVAVVSSSLASFPLMGSSSPSASLSHRDSLVDHSSSPPSISSALHSLLARLSQCPIAPGPGGRLVIVDSGATDHVFSDKSFLFPTRPRQT